MPINFEMGPRGKQALGEASAKARLNGNLTTINGPLHSDQHQQHMKARQEKQLKSSSNPSLRPVKNNANGRSGSINAELAKQSISVSNTGGGPSKHPKMQFKTSDHNLYHHGVGGGFLSPQQANPAVD